MAELTSSPEEGRSFRLQGGSEGKSGLPWRLPDELEKGKPELTWGKGIDVEELREGLEKRFEGSLSRQEKRLRKEGKLKAGDEEKAAKDKQAAFEAVLQETRGPYSAKKLISESLAPKEGEEPIEAWRRRVLVTFDTFYRLGYSRSKGEGDGMGSPIARLTALALQAHLIEEQKSGLKGMTEKGKEISDYEQRSLLRRVAKFGLAAGVADEEEKENPEDSLIERLRRSLAPGGKELIKRVVEEDKKLPEGDQLLRVTNI